MKKFLILAALLVMLPSNAMCSIDDENTACTAQAFREQMSPTYNPQSNIQEFSGTPEARLKPIKRDNVNTQTRNFAPTESNYNYNSSCQFGVCLQNRNTPLFQQTR